MNNEEIPYRSPVSQLPTTDKASSVDEGNYDTLRAVRQELAQAIDALATDFNAFTIIKDQKPEDRAAILLHEVEVRQAAYDILMPVFEAVNSTMEAVDVKYREK